MEKPNNISVKQWIIKNISFDTHLSERTIEDIINYQFDAASIAMKTCNSIEFYGFGKLYFNSAKAQKKFKKLLSQKATFENIMNDETLSEQKRRNASLKLKTALINIEALKHRIYENQSV